MTILFTATQQKIEIESKPFGKGGEGSVHKIISPNSLKDFCVKLYSDKYEKTELQRRQRKIEFMIKNKPSNLNGNVYMICWAHETVFDNTGSFSGFVLPLAYQNSITLYGLCLSDNNNAKPAWLSNFSRKTAQGNKLRLKLVGNIAVAIHKIHCLNKYVFVDMKPENILVTEEGKIAIIDLDSMQIAEHQKIQFNARVATPEYTPPESVTLNPKNNYIPVDWDNFSIAVIFYKIIFGIHPFTASFNGNYHSIATPQEAIKEGLFVNGAKSHYVSVLPPPHKNFSRIHPRIQELFKLAFDNNAHNTKLRPSAEKWGTTVYELITGKPANPTFLNSQTENLLKSRIQQIKGIL